MKLKYTFEMIPLGDTVTAVPLDVKDNAFHGVVNVNETGAFILNLLKEDVTAETVVDRILAEYDGDAEQIRGYADRFIAELSEKGLLEEVK